MQFLSYSIDQNICQLQLNRPERRNALNREMIEEILAFLENHATDNKFRVLVISGANHFFSAGADLQWMKKAANQSKAENIKDANLFNELYHQLYHFPKPVISSVEGGAFGGAIGLLACSDITISSPDARFSFSETSLGLIPATVAPWIIKKTGEAFARWSFLTGETFSGTDARQNGLIQHLVSPDEIRLKTIVIAKQVAEKSPDATQKTKNLLNRINAQFVPFDEELKHYCSTKIAEARISAEGQEGVTAFFEKRKPAWNN